MAGRVGRREKPRDVQLSMAMSMVLRHGASELLASGIRPDGFCVVDEVLEVKTLQDLGCTREDLERNVRNCPKQRFELAIEVPEGDAWRVSVCGAVLVCKRKDLSSEKLAKKVFGDAVRGHPDGEWLALTSEPGFLFLGRPDGEGVFRDEDGDVRLTKASPGVVALIRATQGHSLNSVKDGQLLRPLAAGDADLPGACVHGTFRQHIADILRFGLLAGGACGQDTRQHVHFTAAAADIDAAASKPIAGLRSKSELAVWIDLPAALADSVPFFASRNGVILSPGVDGVVGPQYITKVIDLQTKQWLECTPNRAPDASALALWRREKVQAAVLEQVEFYFGDDNYPTDEFLRGLADTDAWVDLAEVAKFSRLKKIANEDLDFVRGCLRGSAVVQLSADGNLLRRKMSVTQQRSQDLGGGHADAVRDAAAPRSVEWLRRAIAVEVPQAERGE